MGRLAVLWEMVNWYIGNPLVVEELAANDAGTIAIQAYLSHERRGVAPDPGNHLECQTGASIPTGIGAFNYPAGRSIPVHTIAVNRRLAGSGWP
jgi:hypothetical protein